MGNGVLAGALIVLGVEFMAIMILAALNKKK